MMYQVKKLSITLLVVTLIAACGKDESSTASTSTTQEKITPSPPLGIPKISREPPQPAHATRMSREQLKESVMGKTPEEVIALLGRPTRTTDSPTAGVAFYYNGITQDRYTLKTDESVAVWFSSGYVDEVRF